MDLGLGIPHNMKIEAGIGILTQILDYEGIPLHR
jgi:hypothetical protein